MRSSITNVAILFGSACAAALAASASADGDLLYLRLNAKATSEVHGAVYNHVNGEYQEFNDSYIVDSGQNLADYLAFEAIETRVYEGGVNLQELFMDNNSGQYSGQYFYFLLFSFLFLFLSSFLF